MTVITVSRELGSEGDRIAEMLVAELGYRWVDKGLLAQMAQEAGMDEEAVLALERSIPNRARFTSTDMRSLYSKQPGAWEKKGALDDETYRRIVRETMEQYAAEGNVIIIGRGGQMVLRDHPAALHVHLYAPAELRAHRVAERTGISEQDAGAAHHDFRRGEAAVHPLHARQRQLERPEVLPPDAQHRRDCPGGCGADDHAGRAGEITWTTHFP